MLAIIIFTIVVVLVITFMLVKKNREHTAIPFEQLSREEQVTFMENQRSNAVLNGKHASVKAYGSQGHNNSSMMGGL